MIVSEYNEDMFESTLNYINDLEYIVGRGEGMNITIDEYCMFNIPLKSTASMFPMTILCADDFGYSEYAKEHRDKTGFDIFTFYKFIVETEITYDFCFYEELDDTVEYI